MGTLAPMLPHQSGKVRPIAVLADIEMADALEHGLRGRVGEFDAVGCKRVT
jgi:hypothetical protein